MFTVVVVHQDNVLAATMLAYKMPGFAASCVRHDDPCKLGGRHGEGGGFARLEHRFAECADAQVADALAATNPAQERVRVRVERVTVC